MSRAAEKGDKAVVELLLKNGAQPDLEDADGQTPLSRALHRGNADIVQIWLDPLTNCNNRGGRQCTIDPFRYGWIHLHAAIVKYQ